MAFIFNIMALRDQPYLPLYVQDFLTDEKLMECSASATGIYIRLLCIMHKSEEYGVILLKQKDKQTDNQIKNFANKLAKYLPYSTEEIISGISELLSEGVLQNGGDKLSQKRMIRDNEISIIRSEAGKKGVFAKAKGKTKPQANPEDENEDEIVIDTVINYNGILENFHLYCDRMSKVSKLSDQRKKHISARFKEFNYDTIIEVIKKAGKSNFLCGVNEKAWKADFDWIFNPTNFLKIMEGKYDNKEQKPKFVF
jgi:uncharacterized protein YdaU (DUF1376 family)